MISQGAVYTRGICVVWLLGVRFLTLSDSLISDPSICIFGNTLAPPFLRPPARHIRQRLVPLLNYAPLVLWLLLSVPMTTVPHNRRCILSRRRLGESPRRGGRVQAPEDT